MSFNILHQTIVKPDNDIFDNGNVRKNEDAVLVKGNLVAIADGAGGVGLYAREWAHYLLVNLTQKAITTPPELDKWIESIWEKFYEDNLLLAQKDSFRLQKFESEGSLATFCAAWLDEKNSQLTYSVYGDTIIFKYNTKTQILSPQKQYESFSSFNNNPFLLNWKEESIKSEGFESGKLEIGDDEVILLASDGLAQLIYGYYLLGTHKGEMEIEQEIEHHSRMSVYLKQLKKSPLGDFDTFLKTLKSTLESEQKFRKTLDLWWENKWLHRDDYSLIWVEKNTLSK